MRRLGTFPREIEALVVTPDGRFLVARDHDSIRRFSLEGRAPVTLAEIEGGRGLAMSPDGSWLLAGDNFRLLRVPIEGGEPQSIGESDEKWDDGDFGVASVAISPDGKHIAGCGGARHLAEVRAVDGKVVWRGETYKCPYVVRMTNDRIAVGTWDGSLAVQPIDEWDGGDLVDIWHPDFEYPGGPFFDLVFAGDAIIACGAAANGGGWIKRGRALGDRWESGVELPHGVHALALSPDGKRLIAGGNDQALTLLDAGDLRELGRFTLDTHGEPTGGRYFLDFYRTTGPAAVRAVAWHPDGERVYAGLEDGGLVEVTVGELERRSGAIDLLDLKRFLDSSQREIDRQREILATFERVKQDPIAAFLRLEELDPALADAILQAGLRKLKED